MPTHGSTSEPRLPRFEGWETIEKLGEGGMCEVFRARPVSGEEPERAIKVLMDRSDTAIRRFVDEAALLQRIDHPNVVRVHAIDAEARPPWLVMDLLGGRDLDETMATEGRMDPERAARLFADLANGLAAVHAAGVRHRDLKPANIRLGSDGVPRLIDFGIARDANATRHTREGFVVGTAAYLPPEVFEDDDAQAAQDSEAADVYALGQTLCEALTGEATHVHRRKKGTEASPLIQIMRNKLDREFLDPRDQGALVPEELALVVRRATAREPAQRTQTAGALEAQLRTFLAGRESVAESAPISRLDPSLLSASFQPPVLPTAPPPPPLPPAKPRRRWFAMGAVGFAGMLGMSSIAIALVVLVIGGVAALWWFRPDPPGASPSEAILATVASLDGTLAKCRRSSGELTLRVTVDGGVARSVEVIRSGVDRRTERCVARVLQEARYPAGPAVTTDVPVILR